MRKKYSMLRHAVTQPLDPSYRYIPLTRNQNAIVDTADFKSLNRWNWTAYWNKTSQTFYACRGTGKSKGNKTIWMHRVILKCKPTEKVDHENHNGLDNRKENLRPCTRSQNGMNQRKRPQSISGFKGVWWRSASNKWSAAIGVDGRKIYLGLFLSAKEAARAYDDAAKIHHGVFACLNFD